MSLARLFLHERTVEIMIRILEAEENGEKVYPLQISNDLGSPYSYISKVLGEFERCWLTESRVEGRMRVVGLTSYGRKIARMLRDLKKELEKDFGARRRLDLLKEIYGNGRKDFKAIAPVYAELEILKKSTNDCEVLEEVEKLLAEVKKTLEEVA